jgi:hypothetical protein
MILPRAETLLRFESFEVLAMTRPGNGSRCFLPVLLAICALSGCASPYHADRGALFGGLLGAGTGAIIGNAVGDPLAGAAIGTGVGALSGAAIGSGMDEVEAKNRAQIQAQLGRQVVAGAVTMQDVINMTRAGVDEPLIVTHIQAHGSAQPLTPTDLIALKQAGVSPNVIQVLQNTPPRVMAQAVPVSYAAPAPVIVEEVYYGHPCYPCYPRHHCPPRMGWGFSYHGH